MTDNDSNNVQSTHEPIIRRMSYRTLAISDITVDMNKVAMAEIYKEAVVYRELRTANLFIMIIRA